MQSWDLRTLDVPPHQPQILNSDRGESRSILINLPAGEAMQEHEVHERAHVVVIDGDIDVRQSGESVSASAGALVVFDPHERHELHARTDARVLLLLAPWPGVGHPGARDQDG